jgi:hypothetical protein
MIADKHCGEMPTCQLDRGHTGTDCKAALLEIDGGSDNVTLNKREP